MQTIDVPDAELMRRYAERSDGRSKRAERFAHAAFCLAMLAAILSIAAMVSAVA